MPARWRARGWEPRCDDEERDDDGTVVKGKKEKVGAIGHGEGHGRGSEAEAEEEEEEGGQEEEP